MSLRDNFTDFSDYDERYPACGWNARDEALSPMAAYNETLHDLSLEDAMRDAGQTVMRADVTPEEHALLLAVRALIAATQAYEDANAAEDRARIDAAAALDALVSARHVHDNALYAITHPATQNTREDDCS